MITLVRTDSSNPDFKSLVASLDKYLTVTDGDEHGFYDQYNKIDMIKHAVVAYDGTVAVGCGAIKEYDPDSMEVKRMFTEPAQRGKGVATMVLTELERWSKELGYIRCVLETGKRQTEAVAFYHKSRYTVIPNYGQYIGVENSLCFEKRLT